MSDYLPLGDLYIWASDSFALLRYAGQTSRKCAGGFALVSIIRDEGGEYVTVAVHASCRAFRQYSIDRDEFIAVWRARMLCCGGW
jgi:hypothetical protein